VPVVDWRITRWNGTTTFWLGYFFKLIRNIFSEYFVNFSALNAVYLIKID